VTVAAVRPMTFVLANIDIWAECPSSIAAISEIMMLYGK
jgi:hypothetical protein